MCNCNVCVEEAESPEVEMWGLVVVEEVKLGCKSSL